MARVVPAFLPAIMAETVAAAYLMIVLALIFVLERRMKDADGDWFF